MKSPRSIMPEAPPEADLPLAEDQPSAEAVGYLFIPLSLFKGEGICVVPRGKTTGKSKLL